MKRLITFMAFIGLTGMLPGMASAQTEYMPSGPYADHVNIGDYLLADNVTVNPASTELTHNMQGWGAIQTFWGGGTFGGFGTTGEHCRPMWHVFQKVDCTYTGTFIPPSTYPCPDPVFQETGTADTYGCGEPWASLDLDFGAPGGTKTLHVRYLDGGGGATTDDFNLTVGGDAPIFVDTQGAAGGGEVWKVVAIDVSSHSGTETVHFGCLGANSSFTPQYGQCCIDQAGVIIENADPVIAPVAVDADPINCSGSKIVNFHYAPGSTAVRGYTVRVTCDAPVTFSPDDVTVFAVPAGVTYQTFVTEVTAGSVYDIDYVILGGSVGISAEAELFAIEFHGAATGVGNVGIVSASMRDLDGLPITPVVVAGTATVTVDCSPPETSVVPLGDYVIDSFFDITYVIDEEVGSGVVSAVLWYQKDGGGYLEYGPFAGNTISFNAGALGDGFYEFYSIATDGVGNEELPPVTADATTTVDSTAPATHVNALDPIRVDSFFDITYTLDLEAGSGVGSVALFYRKDGDPGYTSYGMFADGVTPLVFDTGPAGTNTGDGLYYFYSIGTDNAGNAEPSPTAPDYDASTLVDTAGPVVTSFWINGGAAYTAGTGVTLAMAVTDAADMQFSNDGVTYSGWVAYAGTYPWTLTAGDGTKTVYAKFRDTSLIITDAQDDIILDTTPPSAVADLTALRGNEKVTLTWTNPVGDLAGLEIWRAVWHTGDNTTSAYPEYDDLNPTEPVWPADHAAAEASLEWQQVGPTLDPAAVSFVDAVPVRGIYYYVVYPVDGGGLYGAGADVRSFSYLLGDVASPYDGRILLGDITDQGTAYGTVPGAGLYNNECDVGPTDDYSGAGMPTTDNYINFEDLMIFALNWDVTVTKVVPAEGSTVARLSLVKIDDLNWSLVLTEPCANLKGVNLRAELPQDGSVVLTAGDLLGRQDGSYFLRNIPSNGLDAGLAILGSGACITGRGELLRLELTRTIDPEEILITARNAANQDLDLTVATTSAAAEVPSNYLLSANYPNPFNPSTKIDFALPEYQHVKLMIYGIDGRHVATLKNESLPAGRYTVTWLGRDDGGELVASGVYFYRIQAGEFIRIQKMTLLK